MHATQFLHKNPSALQSWAFASSHTWAIPMRHVMSAVVLSCGALFVAAVSSLAEPSATPTASPISPAATAYQFTLPYNATTSAAVYTADNKLIRTLWRKETR